MGSYQSRREVLPTFPDLSPYQVWLLRYISNLGTLASLPVLVVQKIPRWGYSLPIHSLR